MKNIKLYCDNKIFKYDGYTLRKGIKSFEQKGEGLESKVFKINNKVVFKVYKDSYEKDKIGKNMIEDLSEIDTNRIVLPNNIITDEEGNTKGYSMDYIEKSDDTIIDFPKKQLIDELSLLKEDLIELGENKVEIGDLRDENTISNEESFYLIDCGDYLKRNKDTTQLNIKYFNEYIIDNVLTDIVFEESTDLLEGLRKLKDIRVYLNEGNYIGDYLEEEMNEEETINDFVKRIVK